MPTFNLHGAYLLLDEQWASQVSLLRVLEIAAQCGVRLFQYRNKIDSMRDAYQKAKPLRQAALDMETIFIVNDRCDLALSLEADGVHLGQEDLPIDLAREILGHEKIIGISTHRPEEVKAAMAEGADYLGFGPIFPTSTKADHEPVVGVEGLSYVRNLTTLPIFAIGGISLDVVPAIQQAGANGVAVASVVYRSENIQQTLQHLVKFFPAKYS
ncbi:thiamine phosphate synthase [Candidatus Nitronereus thalassa]|uniref:Thiamine-phosphate synthase n=1 Tax=Candidatus Nitronereus thalassa TaxID=3020898 RepID=A0ABU3K3R9_9BACT|nr:thiamine phosphate synthase [Candidatus Nitronereus thalassa]MDT7041055.1 thiamine phosphate synthase [Candidatus Nitronereus thalassa]